MTRYSDDVEQADTDEEEAVAGRPSSEAEERRLTYQLREAKGKRTRAAVGTGLGFGFGVPFTALGGVLLAARENFLGGVLLGGGIIELILGCVSAGIYSSQNARVQRLESELGLSQQSNLLPGWRPTQNEWQSSLIWHSPDQPRSYRGLSYALAF